VENRGGAIDRFMIVTLLMDVTSRSPRIVGLDVARALALLGMLVVNYELSLGDSRGGPDWLAAITHSFQGRAAATFVVLAGVGGTLGARRARASGDAAARWSVRVGLLKRGTFLFVTGCLFWTVWPADILHYYGVWLALGAGLVFLSAPQLAGVVALIVGVGAAFVLQGNYFEHWQLRTLEHTDLGTTTGFLRNLFFDGWHPVFPWLALYTFGLWLGRLDLGDRATRHRLLAVSIPVALAVHGIERAWATPEWEQFEGFQWGHLLMTSSVPPTPAFVVAGASIATAVIVLCCELAETRRLPSLLPRVLSPLRATGRLALTHYVGHVIIGLGALEAAGRLGGQTLPFAVASALVYFAFALVTSTLWLKRFERGPLEALMRRF